MDPSNTGVHEVRLPDGTSYQATVTKVRAWVGVVSAIITLAVLIGGLVLAGVKFGVTTQVEEIIEVECDPEGMIDDHIQQTAYEMGEEIQGVIQDDLDYMDNRLDKVEDRGLELKMGQDSIAEQQDRNQAELKMLIQRAIDDGGP